jgi:hypothetical protein
MPTLTGIYKFMNMGILQLVGVTYEDYQNDLNAALIDSGNTETLSFRGNSRFARRISRTWPSFIRDLNTLLIGMKLFSWMTAP